MRLLGTALIASNPFIPLRLDALLHKKVVSRGQADHPKKRAQAKGHWTLVEI